MNKASAFIDGCERTSNCAGPLNIVVLLPKLRVFSSDHHLSNRRNQIYKWSVVLNQICKGLVVLHPVCSRRVLGITNSGNCRVWKVSRRTSHGTVLTNAAGILLFFCELPGEVARAAPNLSKNLHFVDMTPLVQRRLCPCSAACNACAMSTPALVRCRP